MLRTRKQDNGNPDRSGWLCWQRWLKIAICTSLLAVLANLTGPHQPARAQVTPSQKQQINNAISDVEEEKVQPSEWREPPIFKSRDGKLEVTLAAIMAENWIGNKKVFLRSYNGDLVGPTLEVKAGDVLKVKLINYLPDNDDRYCRPNEDHSNKLHCYNTTNLHTHGLHISPKGKSDNVLLNVKPGETFDYEFQVPQNHYPGTFWYHAHRHGSTALQMASGMGGALIIKGSIDEIEGVKQARDRIFVLQQIAFDQDGEIKERGDTSMGRILKHNFNGEAPESGGMKHTTINGLRVPLIKMRPGEVERWRFIDAGIFELLDIRLANWQSIPVPFHEIALDGIALKKKRKVNHLDMVPGYRVDAMVKAPTETGTYWLFKGDSPYLSYKGPANLSPSEILAKVQVTGKPCQGKEGCNAQLPKNDDLSKVPRPNDIAPSELSGKVQKMTFTDDEILGITINNEKFHPNKVDYCLKKGDAEMWELTNSTKKAHPFHIHVNAFQIVDPGPSDALAGDWRDTILVPPTKDDNPIKIATRYEDFDGQFVLHCHILTHEDKGMMSLLEINNGTSCDHVKD